MVIEQDLAVAIDRAQRRPQVMSHRVAEALELAVGSQEIGGAPPDPVLQFRRVTPQRGGLAGDRLLGPPAVGHIPPGGHDPVAELHCPDVESLGHPASRVDILVVNVVPAEWFAGLRHPGIRGQQSRGHGRGEQLREGVPERVFPGPRIHPFRGLD